MGVISGLDNFIQTHANLTVVAVGLAQLLTTMPVLSKGVGFVLPASVVGVDDEVAS